MPPGEQPDAHAVMLERRYRFVERLFALAGMSALGYMISWWLNWRLVHLDPTPSTNQIVMSLVLLVASMLVMMVVVIAEMRLFKLLETLNVQIEAAGA